MDYSTVELYSQHGPAASQNLPIEGTDSQCLAKGPTYCVELLNGCQEFPRPTEGEEDEIQWTVEAAIGGLYARVHGRRRRKSKEMETTQRMEGRRGSVTELTSASRRRLREGLLRLRLTSLVEGHHVVLTFPEALPGREARHCFDLFRRWVVKQHPQSYGWWRVAFQQRLVPHYHLLLLGAKGLRAKQVKERWWLTAGYGQGKEADLSFLSRGAFVRPLRNKNAEIERDAEAEAKAVVKAIFYLSRWEAPTREASEIWGNARWVGELGKRNKGLYEAEMVEEAITPQEAMVLRRTAIQRRLEGAAMVRDAGKRAQLHRAARWLHRCVDRGFTVPVPL